MTMMTGSRSTHCQIPMVLDLCLYRVVNERSAGQVLPIGVLQLTKDYAWIEFDNETLRQAVR